MITLQQARENIGAQVIYRSRAMREGLDHAPAEQGEIRSVGNRFVFVNYGRGSTNQATDPADLEFISRR